MKRYLLMLITMVPLAAFGETVINYDDGSTLTLEEGEQIMVTKGTLYERKIYNNGRTYQFKEFPATTRRDYVPVDNGTNPDMQFGSHAWCKAYVPWSEGYTFTMQYWQRGCDTNNDNKYGCGDEKYDQSEDGAACPSS